MATPNDVHAQWVKHDSRVTCYQSARGPRDLTVETVHEKRSDGSCKCGKFSARKG